MYGVSFLHRFLPQDSLIQLCWKLESKKIKGNSLHFWWSLSIPLYLLWSSWCSKQNNDVCLIFQKVSLWTKSRIIFYSFHAKTYTNGFPFSNGNPLTSRFSSVQQKFASVRTAWAIRLKRRSSRSNDCVIRSQNLPNRSNGQCTRSEKFASVERFGHPFTKIIHPFERLVPSVQKNCLSVQTAVAPVQKNLNPFERLGHPFRKIIHPFKTSISWNRSFKRLGS